MAASILLNNFLQINVRFSRKYLITTRLSLTFDMFYISTNKNFSALHFKLCLLWRQKDFQEFPTKVFYKAYFTKTCIQIFGRVEKLTKCAAILKKICLEARVYVEHTYTLSHDFFELKCVSGGKPTKNQHFESRFFHKTPLSNTFLLCFS